MLRNSLRTSTGHMKAVARQMPNRRDKRAGRGDMFEEEDDFDQMVRVHTSARSSVPLLTFRWAQAKELASDIRASRVTDRLKTADELASEKAAHLAELERKRMKRMRSRDSDEEVESSDDDGPQGGYKARRLKRQKRSDGKDEKRHATVRLMLARALFGTVLWN